MSHTALITGGTRGIGRAVSIRFAKEGYKVIALYKNDSDSAKKLEKESENIKTIRCDVSDYESTERLISELLKNYPDLDVLINNAGISEQKLFCDITKKDWDNMMNVNVGSVYNTTKCLYSHFVNQKRGAIINISSIWGISGASCEVHYSASKAAVIGLTKALAKELGPSGISVNCIAPGVIDTDMNSHLSPDDIAELCEMTPLGRVGKPQEIASLALYLASHEASFITGQIISPNGGLII